MACHGVYFRLVSVSKLFDEASLILAVTTSYAAEVMPVPLRCYLTTYVNLCWVFGQLLASGVLRGVLALGNQWAYRIPFALQWMWPVPLIIGCLLAPESPWWCVRQGRIDQARRTLMRLTSRGRNPDFNLDHTIDMMIHTNEVEKEISSGTRYRDCFKGINLRRTEITCIIWAIQNLSGSSFMVTLPPVALRLKLTVSRTTRPIFTSRLA